MEYCKIFVEPFTYFLLMIFSFAYIQEIVVKKSHKNEKAILVACLQI
jgi:hypothetical protein